MNYFYISTFGCKLNIYESEAIADILSKNGYSQSSNLDNSDIVIINTCTVTTKADAKCRNFIRKARRANQKAIIIVCGCLVNTDLNKLQELNEINILIDNNNKNEL